jgi:hypothetical protein
MARMCPSGSLLLPWLPCAPPPLLSSPLMPTLLAMADTLASSADSSEAEAGCRPSQDSCLPAAQQKESGP